MYRVLWENGNISGYIGCYKSMNSPQYTRLYKIMESPPYTGCPKSRYRAIKVENHLSIQGVVEI